jgi:hypothetical protein
VRVCASLVLCSDVLVHWQDHELFRVAVGLPASLSVCLSVGGFCSFWEHNFLSFFWSVLGEFFVVYSCGEEGS